jgi:hypothetical protein
LRNQEKTQKFSIDVIICEQRLERRASQLGAELVKNDLPFTVPGYLFTKILYRNLFHTNRILSEVS